MRQKGSLIGEALVAPAHLVDADQHIDVGGSRRGQNNLGVIARFCNSWAGLISPAQ